MKMRYIIKVSNLGNYTGALISLDKALAIDPKDEAGTDFCSE
jgi:hypothetical protein